MSMKSTISNQAKTVSIIGLLFLGINAISFCQSDGEEFRDNDFGIEGVVDLYSIGLEDCNLIETDEYLNQYVISYNSNDEAIKIIKLNEDGEQILDYGTNGMMTIDSVFYQRKMIAKVYNDILYLLADDQDTVFLYSITPNGQFNPSFGQGQRIVATNLLANYNIFEMDIIDDLIHVASWTNNGVPYIFIDQYTLEGNALFSDTMIVGDNAGISQLDFKPEEEIYIAHRKNNMLGELFIHFKRFKNLTEHDSSFVYTIPHENFMNFNFHVDADEIITSYLINEFDIKHQRLNLLGEILSEDISPKIDSTENFLFLHRSGILFNSDGYFVLEDKVDTQWTLTYLFTKYNSDLKIDSTFGQDGSYLLGNELGFIVRWRTYDNLDRIYFTFRQNGKFNLIRTKAEEISDLEENFGLKNSLTLYPNPTNSKLTIALEYEPQNPFLYEIIDVNGRIMHQKYLEESTFEIDLSDYPIGIYFISINSSKETYSRMIIKN